MLERGLTVSQIAKAIGVSIPTVCHHARKLGHPPSQKFSKRYDWDEVQAYYDAGHSLADCRQRFGFARASWTEAVKRGALKPRPRAIPINKLLVNGPRRNRGHVKLRLIGAGLKSTQCEGCGISEWLGKAISLDAPRKRERTRNRLVNLRLLCPNCHSQTPTWGGKNRRRVV